MEQHHLALLFDTFTDRVGDRKPVFKYQQGLAHTKDSIGRLDRVHHVLLIRNSDVTF